MTNKTAKKISTNIIIAQACYTVVYLLTAFVKWELSVVAMGESVRGDIITIGTILSLFSIFVYNMGTLDD